MGGVASSKSKTDQKLISQPYEKSSKTQSSSKKDASSKYHSTVYRVSTCKYHEKCPSIKNIKHKHYTIYDLNHLTQYSHPRKHCQYGLKCKYFENVMNGSYSLPDLCHYSIYLHPISRFITSFPKNKKNDENKKDENKQQNQQDTINDNYIQQSMYNSLQMPRSGEKNGLLSYKKLGIMICDGGCGSSITRGLWKCWTFKDLIWNYKYRRFKKNKDPNYSNKKPMSMSQKKKKNKNFNEEDESRKNVHQCLITMIESVVALAGESFLIQMYDLMMKTNKYLNNDDEEDDMKRGNSNDHANGNGHGKRERKNSRKRNSLLGQNKYIEAFKAEMLNNELELKEEEQQIIITDEERHDMEFGELLLLFSDMVRYEFGLKDRDYPIIKKAKKWQCAMIYGVLLGMLNDKLKLNMEKFKNRDIEIDESENQNNDKVYTKSKKRRLKDKRKENIRKQIFTKGCRYSNRDLFKELQINNFTYVLSIPQIKGGTKNKYSKHIEIDNENMYRGSTSSFDDGATGDDDLFDNVSSIVAPNAPPTYRQNCDHYKKFNANNFLNYEWSSLQEVAREKLHHPRHLEMGSCLEEEELLSILLLTGTRVGLDLIESHRKYRNYCKWRVLQTNLISALLKLKSHDRTPNSNQFFHGLLRQKKNEDNNNNNPKSDQPYLSVNNIYLFNTFVSTTLDHRLIESSFHNKKDGALLFLDRREPVICADISWISKFPFEHEVLFAPCALTLPSPFEKNIALKDNINRNKNISPKYAKKYYSQLAQKQAVKNFNEDRERVLSITEISQQQKSGKKNKKSKKKNKKNKQNNGKDERADSLAGFSLVDGRLEALSYDANDQHFLHKMASIQSQTTTYVESENERQSVLSPSAPTININTNRNAAASSLIDNNLIASFLYGKTTPDALFLYLYQQFNIVQIDEKGKQKNKNKNEELFIDEMCLQSLFQSLFLFAIQIEYETRNNGIKPKYMKKYINDLYDFARKYSNMFITKINEENKKYKINTDKITKTQFINNAVYLHQLYEQFIENIIANEMSLQYQKWDDSDQKHKNKKNKKSRKKSNKQKKMKGKIPSLNTGQGKHKHKNSSDSSNSDSNSDSESYDDEQSGDESEQHDDENNEYEEEQYNENDDDDESYDEDDDDDDDDVSDEEDEYYDEENEYNNEYEDEENNNNINIVENVEHIRGFCRSEISLLSLWAYFTDQSLDETKANETQKEQLRAVLMNYIQFDVLVYAALAYFVCERNPNSPLATRGSLNPLIDQLRLSLLAAYDPDNNGYVTYNAFEYFGDYLLGEYSKLRGSLAETPRTKHYQNKQQKFTNNSEENNSLNSFEDDEDINNTNVKGQDSDDGMYDNEEYDANDGMILNSLNSMEENARNIIKYLMGQLEELNDVLKKRENDEDDDDDEHAENICHEISVKTQKLLYLTKEMEIHCNSLKNHKKRYKKAKLINYIDSKREEIQQRFDDIIQIDSD